MARELVATGMLTPPTFRRAGLVAPASCEIIAFPIRLKLAEAEVKHRQRTTHRKCKGQQAGDKKTAGKINRHCEVKRAK